VKIAIIGTGNVAKNLGKALSKKHEVVFGSRNPEMAKVDINAKVTNIEDAAAQGDIIILAIPYKASDEILQKIKDKARNKVVIDVMNALDENFEWAKGFNESVAEEVAKKLENTKVVKAFNTVFAENMSKGKIGREKLTLLVAGDDEEAKRVVMDLGKEIGFIPVDVGNLKMARYLEPMALLLINLGYNKKLGTAIGIKIAGIKDEKNAI